MTGILCIQKAGRGYNGRLFFMALELRRARSSAGLTAPADKTRQSYKINISSDLHLFRRSAVPFEI
jgi:hypothetical protein